MILRNPVIIHYKDNGLLKKEKIWETGCYFDLFSLIVSVTPKIKPFAVETNNDGKPIKITRWK